MRWPASARQTSPMPSPTIAAFDLGSAHLGYVVTESPPAGSLVCLLREPTTLRADESVPDLIALLLADRVSILILEIGPLYIPRDATPQAARQIATNHAACEVQAARLEDACKAIGIEVHRLARSSWSARLVRGQTDGEGNRVPSRMARELVRERLDPAGYLPADQHQIDAAGALLGHLAGPSPKSRKVRRAKDPSAPPKVKKVPVPLKERPSYQRARQKARDKAAEVKRAAGCIGCKRRHAQSCPAYKPGKEPRRQLWRTPQISGRWTETCY